MVNENKIRILYVQPGKYPEERFVANEVHPLQRLVGGYAEDELHVCQTSFEVGSSAWIITVSCQDHVLASSGAITPTRWKAICWLPTARKICAGPIMRLAIQNSPSICTTILTT